MGEREGRERTREREGRERGEKVREVLRHGITHDVIERGRETESGKKGERERQQED